MHVLFVFILLFALPSQANPNTRPGKTSVEKRNTQKQTQTGQPDPSPKISIGECLDCFTVETPHAEQKQQDPYNAREDALYRLYLGFTIAGVIGGLIGLGFLYRQLKATEIAASAAKQNAESLLNSERAWITVDIKMFGLISQAYIPSTLPFFWIRPLIQNVGRTPARITEIYGRAERLMKDENDGFPLERPPVLPQLPDYSDVSGNVSKRENILPPKKDISWFVIYTPNELDNIRARKEFLYVYGYVNYFDIAGREHQTRFCKLYWIPYAVSDATDEGFVESEIIPPDYTRST